MSPRSAARNGSHKNKPMRVLVVSILLVTAAAASLVVWMTARAYAPEFSAPIAREDHDWATSDTCRTCHADHYASWHRTFHRTMTQEATSKTVRGVFDGRKIRYWGATVRPIEKEGKYFFEYLDADDKVILTLPILRTVGSNRYQQYLSQIPTGRDTYYRLHLLWHMGDERWVHINAAFLGPDRQGFDDHVAVWNHNCIYCHNTGPVPNVTNLQEYQSRVMRGERVQENLDLKYSSSVAELGIACETCHGPGGEHARRNRNPLRRYYLHLGHDTDPSIVNPEKLTSERSTQVCGQCHGQRTPKSLAQTFQWMNSGPTYRSGDDLIEHVNPVSRDTHVPAGSSPDLFRLRFWSDATPRLTAYEYQGITQSACYLKGELTCISCHTMHDGDIHGMLPAKHRTNQVCNDCHADLVADPAAHSRHDAEGSGSLCLSCHMPKIVYGVMEIHRSHHIENPDPATQAEMQRPDACTICHLDRSVAWAAAESNKWWQSGTRPPPLQDYDTVEWVRSLLAGDPVQRAVAAKHAGRSDAPLAARQKAFMVPHLLQAILNSYPSTRRFAQKSLLAVEKELREDGINLKFSPDLERFDFIGPEDDRRQLIATLRERWAGLDKSALPTPPPGSLLDNDYNLQPGPTTRLLALGARQSNQINIGE